MKEKIIAILKEYQHVLPPLDAVSSDLAITDDQFDEVADDIIKLYNLKDVNFRYLLFSQKDLTSKRISQSNNKQELKKTRTGWRYQMLLTDVGGEIYDTKTCKWIP
jgi:hypothetical protein